MCESQRYLKFPIFVLGFSPDLYPVPGCWCVLPGCRVRMLQKRDNKCGLSRWVDNPCNFIDDEIRFPGRGHLPHVVIGYCSFREKCSCSSAHHTWHWGSRLHFIPIKRNRSGSFGGALTVMVVCSILPDFSQCVGNSVHLFGNNTQCSQMMMTFIQVSSLVPLIEGLCSSNSISIRVLGFAFLNRCLLGIDWDS